MKNARRVLKRIIVSVGAAAICIAVLVALYLVYVFGSYYRIEDNKTLEPSNIGNPEKIRVGKRYRALTMNVGFGAYDENFSFFMDEGYADTDRRIKISGRQSRATSRNHVLNNISGAVDTIKNQDADFIILQEVDKKATRSYHVDQVQTFFSAFPEYSFVWAVNYHSPYLFYPLNEPHGKSLAGLVSLSRADVSSAVRRMLPLSDSRLSNVIDLDRAIVIGRYDIEGSEKEFVLINVHLSAYDSGGSVRKKQMSLLREILEAERKKENYVLMGGDFNQVLIPEGEGYYVRQGSGEVVPDWVAGFDYEFEGYTVYGSRDGDDGAVMGTARNVTRAYDPDWTYTCSVDGFIASSNMEVFSVMTVTSHAFRYSDHNPVVIDFALLPSGQL